MNRSTLILCFIVLGVIIVALTIWGFKKYGMPRSSAAGTNERKSTDGSSWWVLPLIAVGTYPIYLWMRNIFKETASTVEHAAGIPNPDYSWVLAGTVVAVFILCFFNALHQSPASGGKKGGP